MIIVGYSRQATPAAAGTAPRVIATHGTEVPTSSANPLAIALPTGGGAIAEGDMVLVAIFCDQSLTGGGVTAGQGYADIAARSVSSSPGYQIGYKFMGPAPDSQVAIDVNTSRPEVVLIAVIRGVDPSTPLDGAVQSATGAGGAMPNPPGCTTQTANALRVVIGGCDDASAISAMPPAGFTELVQYDTTAASAAGCMAFRQEAQAGALDPDAFGGTAGSSATVAFHFALRAAA